MEALNYDSALKTYQLQNKILMQTWKWRYAIKKGLSSTCSIPAPRLASWRPWGCHSRHHCSRLPWGPPWTYNQLEEVHCLLHICPVFHHARGRAPECTSAHMDSRGQWVALCRVAYRQPSAAVREVWTTSVSSTGQEQRWLIRKLHILRMFAAHSSLGAKPLKSLVTLGKGGPWAGQGKLATRRSWGWGRESHLAIWSAWELAGLLCALVSTSNPLTFSLNPLAPPSCVPWPSQGHCTRAPLTHPTCHCLHLVHLYQLLCSQASGHFQKALFDDSSLRKWAQMCTKIYLQGNSLQLLEIESKMKNIQMFQKGVIEKITEWQYTKYFVATKKYFWEKNNHDLMLSWKKSIENYMRSKFYQNTLV